MVPKNHILRLINKYVDFSFIHKEAKHLYSDIGRPSGESLKSFKKWLEDKQSSIATRFT
ncbi:MAG: hypothetical protein U9N18_01865 [Campylobacterota bacterium]|nr:hypothetical protein [Campylobacterota bacterium]